MGRPLPCMRAERGVWLSPSHVYGRERGTWFDFSLGGRYGGLGSAFPFLYGSDRGHA